MKNTIINADVLDGLNQIPDEFVDCVVTSPPYYGLRDYGVEGQIGLEKTSEEYVKKMVEVCREIKRVLKKEGTFWLNLGDSYYNYRPGRGQSLVKQSLSNSKQDLPYICARRGNKLEGLKEKDLIGIPWRVAFALQSDGWYLRQDIIWAKPNPMPESVTDRCTKSHEYIFLMSKSSKYYFDSEAIKEPLVKASHIRLAQDIANQRGSNRVPGKTNGPMKAVAKGLTFGGQKRKNYKPKIGDPNFRNGFEQWGREYIPAISGKANKRSVWTVATQPYKDAHFATFSPKLITPCILAGCPPEGIVLDCFIGSGTTALVARSLGRNYIGIELNKDYLPLIEKRLAQGILI